LSRATGVSVRRLEPEVGLLGLFFLCEEDLEEDLFLLYVEAAYDDESLRLLRFLCLQLGMCFLATSGWKRRSQ